jgi:acyl-[acyl-carrier-protein]-phospholipid O-acyltransferase / long-chain-fatty-acid--[acyl-carrier-protein] ligase
MISKLRNYFSSFSCLNIAQFFTVFNDNLYKLILVFFLINLLGKEQSNTILALAGAIFVIPFLLFAAFSGSLSDRYSKRSIIFFTRGFEIIATLLGILAIYLQSVVGGYAVLFLLALQSTLMSPAKMGMIVEITPKGQLASYNGAMTATSYLAVILGTFFASFIADMTHRNFVLCTAFTTLFAIISALFSLGIEPTVAQAKEKKLSLRFVRDIIVSLGRAYNTRYLLTVILFGAYFLFMGAYAQLNMIPYAMQSLGLTEIEGGYLFLLTALGIGVGSYLAGRLSGSEVELAFSPIAGFASFFCYMGLYYYTDHLYLIIVTLFLMGVCGGFYVVPLDTFIQLASPNEDRGENIATANFINFSGVILASGFLALTGNVFNLSAANGFFILGWVTLLTSSTLVVIFSDQIFRFFFSIVAWLFWDLKVVGKARLFGKGPVVLIGQKTSWLDGLAVLATLPRLTRYIVPVKKKRLSHSFLYRFQWLIPMKHKYAISLDKETLKIIAEELKSGHSICLMQPTKGPSKRLNEWKEILSEKLQDFDAEIVPIHIERRVGEQPKGIWEQFLSLFRYPIRVAFGSSFNSTAAQ